MARIKGNTQEKVFPIKQWGGLNENPDGDTKLKLGEASVMTNWRVTRDGNLKRRPGSEFICGCCPLYDVSVSDEIEVIRTANNITVYMGIHAEQATVPHGVPGTLILDGTETQGTKGTANYTNHASYTGWYHNSTGRYWMITSATRTNGVTTWYGKRVKAVPAAGNAGAIDSMWSGWLNGSEILLVACKGFIYKINPSSTGTSGERRTPLNEVNITTENGVHMFGFQNKVYFLNGAEYYEYDGTTFKTVDGYIPLVAIGLTPDGANEQLEHVNLLCGGRRVWLSPDGKTDGEDAEHQGRTFYLPEKGMDSIDYVKDLKTGNNLPGTAYVVNLTNGTVTFSAAPAQGVNSYEVCYTMGTTYRNQVYRMRYSELYSGTQDTRVFLYGDGSNRYIYSGIDYYGVPRADYFADLDGGAIGDSNTPITSMIRHYSTLVAFKRGSAWSLTYGVISLTDNTMTPAFYGTPVNRRVGNEPLGQVVLVNNSPVTLSNGEVYQWSNSSYYSSNLTQDERQARRISDRVQQSLKSFAQRSCFCFDDNYAQEYYICYNKTALVWNYAADAWYKYTDLDMVKAASYKGVLYYGTSDGQLLRLNPNFKTNNYDPIESYWESGAMDFGQDYMRKYSAMLWIGLKPDPNLTNRASESITVTVKTDRKETFSEKISTTEKAKVATEPFMTKLKIKAKKFTFYTLILKSDGTGEVPTVTSADIRVRFQGYAK